MTRRNRRTAEHCSVICDRQISTGKPYLNQPGELCPSLEIIGALPMVQSDERIIPMYDDRDPDPLNVGRKAHHTGVVFAVVNAHTFGRHFDRARNESAQVADATSPFDITDPAAAATVYVLSTDGRTGFAIRPDGELVYVFSTVKGRGDIIMGYALHLGAVYLDCFAGYLVDFYTRHGFEIVATVPNWTPGGPDVTYMSLPGYAHRHGVSA